MAASPARLSSPIVFVEVLRGAAAALVVYDHLFGQWLDQHGAFFRPSASMFRYFERPFVIIQHFGWLGVALFFLISGFIITHVAIRESGPAFLVKRGLRIYPPLIVAVLVAALDVGIRRRIDLPYIPGQPLPAMPGATDVLSSMTLSNYLMVPQPIVLGVAWSLVIEVIFYAFMFLLLPVLRRKPVLCPVILVAVVAICIHEAKDHGPSWFLFCVSVSYLPLLVLGQLLWLLWTKHCGVPLFLILSGLTWVVFIRGLESIYPQFLEPANAYGPSILLGYGLFALGLALEGRIPRYRLARWLAERSYSLYLLHGTVGILVLDLIYQVASFPIAALGGLVASLVSASLSYRYVERPSQQLARRITATRQPAVKPPAQSSG